MSEQHHSIIIVGAGMAGLTAASKLRELGHESLILEGRPRLGGRVSDASLVGEPIELGAFLLHNTEENPLLPWLDQQKLSYSEFKSGALEIYQGDHRLDPQMVRRERGRIRKALWHFHRHTDQIPANKHMAASVFSHIVEKHGSIHPMVWSTFLDTWAAVEGDDPEKISMFHLLDQDGGGGDALPDGGMSRVIKALAQDLTIQRQTVVEEIHWESKPLRLVTSKGEYTADKVLLTVPLGVLKSGKIRFYPELPDEKAAAIGTMGFGLLNKVILAYGSPFWPEGPAHWSLFDDLAEEPFGFTSYANPTAPILTVFLGGERARRLEGLSDSVIIEMLSERLRFCFGADIPDPSQYIITRWGTDPMSLGGYSYLPTEAAGTEMEILSQPLNQCLFFAGEATVPRFYATVHGAWLSGLREAERIASIQ